MLPLRWERQLYPNLLDESDKKGLGYGAKGKINSMSTKQQVVTMSSCQKRIKLLVIRQTKRFGFNVPNVRVVEECVNGKEIRFKWTLRRLE